MSNRQKQQQNNLKHQTPNSKQRLSVVGNKQLDALGVAATVICQMKIGYDRITI